VTITAAGRQLVARVTRHRRREIDRILAQVPDRQRASMVAALRAFANAAGEAPDQAWTTGWDL
jgi:DNA-binding MarR family transcriptional regulator